MVGMAITDRAGLDKAPAEVAAMFDGVAKRYDITNTVLSFAQDRRWRKATRKALALGPSDVVLDLAAGTAVSTVELSASGATCIAADFSLGMLKAGADRAVPKVAADALALPFADGSFDAATISFGLRNVNDVAVALGELNRVLRPGGRLAICEFSTPTFGPFRTVYMEYLMKALPAVATKVSSNPAAYVYLAESIRAWPDQFGLGDLIRDAGFTDVRWQNLTGGIAAVHTGRKA
ncbi:demethylmenaquinone methyltransferase [Gordonia aichiensis NBRC 108223]|uniref:Demethylmenaquinone methyltransferase n=2 Tax=Gordonia aichiensis TaxID=36820 RepID=L7KEN9_9ACTN|nr:demethylmenaquinone methyltransferase [Gordonia aichiensis NBRC 108223]